MSVSGNSPALFKISQPGHWLSACGGAQVRISGWFQDAHGRPARVVRVHLGDRVVDAAAVSQVGVEPAQNGTEVLGAGAPQGNRGFYAAFATSPGWKWLRIEAEDAQGRTWRLGTRLVWVHRNGPPPDSYSAWIRCFDTLNEADHAAMRKQIATWPRPPRFFIVIGANNASDARLLETVESVRAQIYPNWILAGTAESPSTAEESKISQDDFIVLLEPGCRLRPQALFVLADALQSSPGAALLYADDDERGPDGRRRNPDFKPDWNPTLLLGQNYLGGFIAIRSKLLDQPGGSRMELASAGIWETALRVTAIVPDSSIVHLPQVLSHRPATTPAEAAEEKKPAKIVGEHLRSRGVDAAVETSQGRLRIRYALPRPVPKVSLAMPSACRLELLRPCLKSILEKTRYPDYEILLAVNAMRDEVPVQREFLDEIARDPRVRVLRYADEPFNIARIINRAAQHATGTILGCLNDDLEIIHADWLEQMTAAVLQEGVGMTSPILYYPNDTIQHAGFILGVGGLTEHAYRGLPRGASGHFGRAALAQDVSCVTGACFVTRRALFAQLGGFCESLPVNYNDVDFCLRVRDAGWRVVWMPSVELYHHESATIRADAAAARARADLSEQKWLKGKWAAKLAADPNYNPNLSLVRGLEWQPAFPPRVRRTWRME